MTDKPPLTAVEHIDRAKAELATGADPGYAIAHALVAIAEIMATNMNDVIIDAVTRGAMATANAFGGVMSVLNPGGVLTNTIWPCTVKSAGGRTCIHNVGHTADHQDQHGWTWQAAGERAHPGDESA